MIAIVVVNCGHSAVMVDGVLGEDEIIVVDMLLAEDEFLVNDDTLTEEALLLEKLLLEDDDTLTEDRILSEETYVFIKLDDGSAIVPDVNIEVIRLELFLRDLVSVARECSLIVKEIENWVDTSEG